MLNRERRFWTASEDQLLRDAVKLEDPDNPNPSKWHAISKHVPNRTNKDCRKRWFATMATEIIKGGWSSEEDNKLIEAIEKCGTKWSSVASMVQTRNSDQCAKRWTDTLNPTIDRTGWTTEADALLVKAVREHGKFWTKIVKMYFPGRTGLSAKNRYNSITRYMGINSGTIRCRSPSTPTSPFIHPRGSVSSSSASTSSSSTTEDLSEVSLLTTPEQSLDQNTWPVDSAAASMGEMDFNQFTYEDFISALSPLHHDQEQLSMHQNFDINSDAYTMSSPARETSSGYDGYGTYVCNPLQEQFSLGSGSTHDSFDTDILPTANQDPWDEGLLRCFTLDSSVDFDMYDCLSSRRENDDQAIQSLHSYLLPIDSPSYPASYPMNNSATSQAQALFLNLC
ncbi:hypothetical protein VKT23_008557 [Stygiomarasmius scandens]|uniref:Uncharacterized protein n=1 Tax=Marasmiellus scandens TaxID=2682957 RepID=A0ABR1JLG0_9AGAR